MGNPGGSGAESPQLLEARQLLASKGSTSGVGSHFEESENLPPYGLTPDQMMTLIDPKNPYVLQAIGGPERLEKILLSNAKTGLVASQLTEDELGHRNQVYGENKLREKKQTGLFKIMLMTLDDKVLIILIVAALISLALGLYETFGEPPEYDYEGHQLPKVDWVEGVAILVAVVIVTVVGSVNDWQKEHQFARLNRKKDERMIEVMRNDSQQQIPIESVVVGDVVLVQPGDVLAVDGVVEVANDIECDESSVTGESDTMRKVPAAEAMNVINSSDPNVKHADCFMISGAKVLQGTGRYLVTAVGDNSMWGRTMLSLHEGTEVTPLQEKLNRVADAIAKFGVWSALILFIVLFIRFCVQISGNGRLADLTSSLKGNHFMDIFIVSVTIVVVAVPEGLPLAVTLALAFATTRMVKDNCLVRVLKSCETMGGATTVCSDKTGTLTQNKMTVVRSLIGQSSWELPIDKMKEKNSETADDNEPAENSNKTFPFIHSHRHHRSSQHSEDKSQASEADEATQAELLSMQGKKPVVAEADPLTNLMRDSICLNSTVYENSENPQELVGSKTEIALVNYVRAQFSVPVGSLQSYRESRPVVYTLPFDSSRKFMATVLQLGPNQYRLLVKGAAEIIMARSTLTLPDDGIEGVELTDDLRKSYSQAVDNYADMALRCIGAAYKDFSLSRDIDWSTLQGDRLQVDDLVFMGLFGIQDPLRPGVKEAVMQCQRAGVIVRMVTGDNVRTARAISINANIIPNDPDADIIVMEGPKFRELSDMELEKIVPRLRVLARSSPQDKRRLVEFLKEQGETVAVTGDGTNDAPALRLADVGFSMGITGTEVAKEASDIIIMDDNFASIVNALKWGRTVNDAVKKFLQFQLTVNVTAVALTFISAVASADNESVLTAVQLLWVNLIMDTLAALALATDAPTDAVLDRPPDNRKVSLITPTMWKMIFGQALFQLAVTFTLHFAGRELFNYTGSHKYTPSDHMRLSAMVFNAFVWMQFFNMFVNRRLDNKQNVFVGLTRNPFFPLITAVIGGFQVLIMFVGGAAFSIKHSTPAMWATAIICGFCSIPVGMLLRLVPDQWVMILFPRRAWRLFMRVLDGIEAGFLWLMSPISFVFGWLFTQIKKLFGYKPDKEEEKDNPDHKEGHGDETNEPSHLVDRHIQDPRKYQWMPGIEKSIADLSFLRKVRGGRSRQLRFHRVVHPQQSIRRRSTADSFHSDTSTLAAFMAPFVVSGAVGGWAPLPREDISK